MLSSINKLPFLKKLLLCVSSLMFLLSFASYNAFAQSKDKDKAAQPQTVAPEAQSGIKVPLKNAPEQAEWLKVCGTDPSANKTICYTTRDFVAENNQPVLAVAIYAIKEDSKRFVRFLVPLTFLIQPGVRFSAEGTQPISAKFQICLPQGCFVEGELNDNFINSMKKSSILKVDMQNQIGQEVSFEVPLTGFAKIFDGPGIDQETLIKMQQQGQNSAPSSASGAAAAGSNNANSQSNEELKKKGNELLKQRQTQPATQNAPKQ